MLGTLFGKKKKECVDLTLRGLVHPNGHIWTHKQPESFIHIEHALN